MSAVVEDWQAEAIDLKKQGLDTDAIAAAVGKSAPTVRKAIAKAREAGEVFPGDEVHAATNGNGHHAISPEDAERLAQAAESGEIPGQTTVDEQLGDVPPEDDPEPVDPLDEFRAEAGEAVGAMPPSRAVDPQDGLFDVTWEDSDLEAILEAREETRAEKLSAAKAHKIKDDEAKALLEKYTLAVGEVARIGRFRIKKTRSEGNEVSFTTEPREQLRIAVDPGE